MGNTRTAATSRQKIMTGIAGNFIEWYDFAVYGFVAPVIAVRFFPTEDPTAALIATFGAFAAGFLMRPIGAILFGHIGDRIGRPRALIISVVMMAIPTVLIGLLPTYETIGVWAGVLLTMLRLTQGLSVGGEYSSSIVYLTEHAPPAKRGLYGSWALFGAWGGILAGSAIGTGVASFVSTDAMLEWGWRIPFLCGVVFGIIGVLLRIGLRSETGVGKEGVGDLPLKQTIRNHGRDLVRCVGLNLAAGVSFYLVFVYSVSWLVDYVGVPQSTALQLNTFALMFLLMLAPVYGRLSDVIGRRTVITGGALGLMLFSYPLFWLMHHPDPIYILFGQFTLTTLTAAVLAPSAAAMSEMFPRNVRVTALGLGYNLSIALFGGLAPLVALWLIQRTHNDLAFTSYVSAAALVTLVAASGLKDRRREPLD